MPRVTKADLEQENAELKAELAQRDRSRSRRRKAAHFDAEPMSSASRRALDVVRKHDRDGVVEEQRQTITRQAQEIMRLGQQIADLRLGKGRIAPILASDIDPNHTALLETVASNKDSVADYVKNLVDTTNLLRYEILYGV